MDRKIGIIASDIELKDSIIELFPEEVASGEIIIDILDPLMIEEQGKALESKGAKAIIARSGGYRHTVGKVSIPVIHLKITTMDIVQAIKRADKYKKDIVLLISDLEYFNCDEWQNLVQKDILVERFHSASEIEIKVSKYMDRYDKVTIVGGGIPCSYARKLGMSSVSIGASKESINEGIAYARELIDNLQEQKYRNEVLGTVLDGVHDAVIAIDNGGKIIIFNERAKELLRYNLKQINNKKVTEVLPELGFMLEVLKNKTNRYNEIRKLKNIIVTANTSILVVEGQVNGVICSFQDITKLQNLEKKIRYELNKKGLVAKYRFQDIIAEDPVMKDVISKAVKTGFTDFTVMIYGESGTGKEMVAQSIHNISSRSSEPFVAVNCAAISESLLESELFGYEEGAFTGARKGGKPGLFELAHGGTIFLDEINSMSLNLQAKLLRVLEEKEVMRIGSDYVIPLDVRVIAAANEELKQKVQAGSFRSDLFYRISILELKIPPLRERKKDIVPLFTHYLEELSQTSESVELQKEVEKKIVNYNWPGNVRELKNMVQRYMLFKEISIDDSELIKKDAAFIEEGYNLSQGKVIDLKEINKLVENKVIEMLASNGMSKSEIAKQLGISRTALWKKGK
ncbi:sigma 54-interacting transcriptional regulator [Clostridium omnivorum]|uniref:Fis family transcriptional regulator n=1 Tax=Clostridium omnivorum TaxID=1604902 RepID=A0ABQ5N2P0_9CLOT|nr:sigma 54-interacting transcriptional regulator [Clostridium sp. E14]GLC29482.1 Fis family transcriptional regulator [Clostridium sp. E14]